MSTTPDATGSTRPRRQRHRHRRWRWALTALLLLAAPALTVVQVLTLRWLDPPVSAFMLAHRTEAREAGRSDFRIDYRWRDWAALSPELPIALVAAEDQRFPHHRGFDFEAIDAALSSHRDGARLRGASTLSQQVARNLYLWPDRSWLRKGLEAWYTVLIEALWPKRRILEVYANIAEFGDGVYGAEAAAQRFFDKPASRLSAAESARLAAVLPNPRRYSASAPSPYVRQRQHWIERQVVQLGGPSYLAVCCGAVATPDPRRH